MRVRNEELYIKTSQLEAAATSINSIFQKDDYKEFKTALNESILTAEKLIQEIKNIVNE